MALLAVKAVAVTKLASGGSCAYGHGVAFRPWTHGGIYLLSPVAPTGDQTSLTRLSNHGTSGDTDAGDPRQVGKRSTCRQWPDCRVS